MADAIVRIQSTTSGDTLIDNSAVSVAGSSVRRERIVLADDSAAGGLAPVSSSAGLLVNLSNLLVQVVASSTGGNQPVSIANALVSVLVSTSGGALPTSVSGLVTVVASSTGGAQPVAQTGAPWTVVASSTGGAQPVVQSAIPWTVVASTTGGSQPVSVANALLVVVSSTTGGAIAVGQSTTPWPVVASSTGGSVPTLVVGTVRAGQPNSIADGTTASIAIDTKARPIVTPFAARQLITAKYLQVTATGETVLVASSSGSYRDLLFLCISAATSNTVSSACTIKDSSGGNTQFLLNIPSAGTTGLNATVIDLPVPWPQSTATSTGNAWTVNFAQAGVYNVSALFVSWSS